MITVLKQGVSQQQIDNLVEWFEKQGLRVHISEGEYNTILGLIGDTSKIDVELLSVIDIVESVKEISEPFKNANRKFHPDDTVIEVGDTLVGGGNFAMIAGPCSIESKEQILEVAEKVKISGATMLRGGAFKPRTSPYDFQGMREDGLELLVKAKEYTGLPIVTEIMDINHIPLFENIDVIQVGARNMQNFELLKELGKLDKPILLKRGLANTIKEWLMSAEYIMAGGNENVILCERGIRTFETYTRNTLDLSAIPVVKRLSHLPIIVDPSHATGSYKYVYSMALAAGAAGADGLMIEVHNNPAKALCDGAQSLNPEEFSDVVKNVRRILEVID